MASTAPIKSPSLQPLDWIHAAYARLSAEGIDAVRVEVLARELGVSKGSFYWHFRDREDLLDKMLGHWEMEENGWFEGIASFNRSAAARWAQFVERVSQPDRARLLIGFHSWARRDPGVAGRIAALEAKRSRLIADVLQDIGLSRAAAETWSQVVHYAFLGWLDRSTREPDPATPSRQLGDILSELIRAASANATP
jgi:AcrR family transcriptional regulator